MKSIFKYIALFICFSSFAQTLTSPQIGCVSILPNGNIAITWSVTPSPILNSQFASYNIYTSPTDNPPWTKLGPINNYNTNSCVITTITNANTQPYYVYVQTVNTSSATLPAVDTVRPLLLEVSQVVASPGVAHLTWNGFSPPIPAGEVLSYSIYKNYNKGGGWFFDASVPFNANGNINYNYYDTITYCHAYVTYSVGLTNNALNCVSASDTAGGYFENQNAPTSPHIDSVSTVNNGTEIIIGISSAYSQDVKCFNPGIYSPGNYTQIGTVCTHNRDTIFTYATAPSPSVGSVTLSVVAEDSCGNISAFPLPQRTIYTTASYDQCKKTMVINWTPYQNMVTGVHDYQIFCSTNNSSFVLIGDTNATVYYQKGVLPGTNYCYFVRAHSNGKTIAGKDTASSTSNQFCLSTNSPPVSQFAYLNNVTVNAQQTINIQWHVDNSATIGGYNLYRATSKTGVYSLVTFVPYTHLLDNTYTDGNVNTNVNEYFYFVQVLDSCLNPTIQTDTSNSILLKAVPSANLTATLNWNNYAMYLGGVSGYTIYRSINNAGFAPINTVTVTTYVDDLSPYAADEGMFLYYVEALEGNGDPYFFTEISQSNYDTVYMDANLYIPNCFTPNGKNKVFLPIGAYIDNTNYTLDIFDRYGVKIFESTDPNTGWDGGGHQEGIYAYTVKYQTSIGEFRQRHGTVNLIR